MRQQAAIESLASSQVFDLVLGFGQVLSQSGLGGIKLRNALLQRGEFLS